MNEVPHVKPKALGTAGGGAVGAAAGRARPDRQECRPVHPEPGLAEPHLRRSSWNSCADVTRRYEHAPP